jgi:nodulation protein F
MTNELSDRVIRIIATQLRVEPGKVTRETHLDDLGVDSLQLVEIISELEDEFGIEVEMNAAQSWDALRDVGSLIDQIDKLAAARA